jgi:hypothetical protein
LGKSTGPSKQNSDQLALLISNSILQKLAINSVPLTAFRQTQERTYCPALKSYISYKNDISEEINPSCPVS